MSNIYITEPPTSGKVCLTTTVGDIEIELWSKEAPRACRNFVQHCLNGYYNKTIFHRVVRDFIAQGGDPTGTGNGGDSIYGEPFKTELHSRLRFNRRGLVAMASPTVNDNRSQFFFTLGEAAELDKKHTIFGKVVGNTLFNMLKLGEYDTDQHERPIHPQKIIKAEIIDNPYPDMVAVPVVHNHKEETEVSKPKRTSQMKATKNFSLLSFGEEAEDDEAETEKFLHSVADKVTSKSSHDLLNDPKLSSEAVKIEELKEEEAGLKSIKEKLRQLRQECEMVGAEDEFTGSESVKQRTEKYKQEYEDLKRSMQKDSERKRASKSLEAKAESAALSKPKSASDEFIHELKKYKATCKVGKGSEREAATMALFSKFKSKLDSAGKKTSSSDVAWMQHKLECEEKAPTKARDANVDDPDRYHLFDPRNPLNKRKRDAMQKEHSQSKKPR